MNFGIPVDLAEIAATLEMIIFGVMVVLVFIAGWTARGICG